MRMGVPTGVINGFDFVAMDIHKSLACEKKREKEREKERKRARGSERRRGTGRYAYAPRNILEYLRNLVAGH